MLALNGLPSRITRCSTCRASRWPAATGSSSASRRRDPKFDLDAHARSSSRALGPAGGDRRCGLDRRRRRGAADPRTRCADVCAVRCARRAARAVAGCRQDMHDQPKYKPLARVDVLRRRRVGAAAGRRHRRARPAARRRRCSTPARSTAPTRRCFRSRSTRAVLARGQERFNIYCSPCHGRTGDGDGMVVQRGYRRPPSYHDDRLRDAPVGHFFDVITNGFGAMPDYAAQITADGSLGDRRLHPRAAAERARDARRRAGGRSRAGWQEAALMALHADRRRADSRAARATSGGCCSPAASARWSSLVGCFIEPDAVLPVVPDGATCSCLGITLGCLALGMVHQLSGGAWGVVIRRPIGAAARVAAGADACCSCRSRSACTISTTGRTPTSSRTTRSCSTSSCT